MNKKLGSHLKRIRRQRKLSLRSVEDKTGISNAYLSQLENGVIRKPSPLVLHKLARCYDVSYDHLMKLAGHPVSDQAASHKAISAAHRIGEFSGLTHEEEEKLLEYLHFLRSRGKLRR